MGKQDTKQHFICLKQLLNILYLYMVIAKTVLVQRTTDNTEGRLGGLGASSSCALHINKSISSAANAVISCNSMTCIFHRILSF